MNGADSTNDGGAGFDTLFVGTDGLFIGDSSTILSFERIELRGDSNTILFVEASDLIVRKSERDASGDRWDGQRGC